MAEIFHIVRSEHVAAAGDPVVETSTYQMFDSLPVPVTQKKQVTRRKDCEMLEKTFTVLTSLAAAAASADDDVCRSFGTFIANRSRNYLPRIRNKVQHEVSNTRGFLVFYILSPTRPQHPMFPLPPLLPLLLV